jgi:hypothetical protein
MIDLLSVVVILLGGAIYLLPLVIGLTRGVRDIGSVAVINILLGWTLAGWVLSLALAMRSVPPGTKGLGQLPPTPPYPPYPIQPPNGWAGPPWPPPPPGPPPLSLAQPPPGPDGPVDQGYRPDGPVDQRYRADDPADQRYRADDPVNQRYGPDDPSDLG